MARPRKTVDWEAVSKLCALHCTQEEIAAFLEVSLDTIERHARRDLKRSFAEVFDEKKRLGKISLRRKQFQCAMQGDKTMLVWLGKQFLGQSDKLGQSSDVRIVATKTGLIILPDDTKLECTTEMIENGRTQKEV